MHKSATKCNETIGKWCKNKHGASKIIDTFETYQEACNSQEKRKRPLRLRYLLHARYSSLIADTLSLAMATAGVTNYGCHRRGRFWLQPSLLCATNYRDNLPYVSSSVLPMYVCGGCSGCNSFCQNGGPVVVGVAFRTS
jgi:hypothetical protein